MHARCELPSICTSHSCVLQEIIMIRFSLCSLWMLYARDPGEADEGEIQDFSAADDNMEGKKVDLLFCLFVS